MTRDIRNQLQANAKKMTTLSLEILKPERKYIEHIKSGKKSKEAHAECHFSLVVDRLF